MTKPSRIPVCVSGFRPQREERRLKDCFPAGPERGPAPGETPATPLDIWIQVISSREGNDEGPSTERAQPLAGKSRQQPAVWESDCHGDGNQIQGFLLQLTFKTKLQRRAVLFDFSALGTRVAHDKRNRKTGNIPAPVC